MYWAYRKGLLETETTCYLSEWSIKLLVIYYYLTIGKGIPNIIDVYKKDPENAHIIHNLRKMYTVNKKMDCELSDELFGYCNFALRRKRGFYVEATRRYAEMMEILVVPYPIVEDDVDRYSSMLKKNNQRNRRNGGNN